MPTASSVDVGTFGGARVNHPVYVERPARCFPSCQQKRITSRNEVGASGSQTATTSAVRATYRLGQAGAIKCKRRAGEGTVPTSIRLLQQGGGKGKNMSENLHVGVAGVYRFVEILDTRYLMR